MYNLRELVLTTVIMAPARVEPWVGAPKNGPFKAANSRLQAANSKLEGFEGSNSGSVIWMHRNNGFSAFG